MSSSNFLSKFSRLSTMFSNNKEIYNNDKYKDIDYYKLAIFHQFFTFKNNLIKKYYNLCIKNNINKSDSLNNLGFYYITQEKNYDLGKKYYGKKRSSKVNSNEWRIFSLYFNIISIISINKWKC